MKITWFGQACFEIVTQGGLTLICDPYHPLVGYEAHPRPADIVTISHEHGDHNHTGWIEGTPEIVRGVGTRTVKGVNITGLPSFHDGEGGAKRGPNTVFVIEADGLRLCHLGDLGELPGVELYDGIGKPDVLMIPVGGFYTIDGEQAAFVARSTGARLTIPMHYATGVKETPISAVDCFVREMGARAMGGASIEIFQGDSETGTVVLDFLR